MNHHGQLNRNDLGCLTSPYAAAQEVEAALARANVPTLLAALRDGTDLPARARGRIHRRLLQVKRGGAHR